MTLNLVEMFESQEDRRIVRLLGNPFEGIRQLTAEYAEIDAGHQTRLRRLLADVARVVEMLQPGDFLELKKDPIVQAMNERANDNRYRAVMYKIMNAKTKAKKKLASKYAKVLEYLRANGLDPEEAFEVLEKDGIERISMRANREAKASSAPKKVAKVDKTGKSSTTGGSDDDKTDKKTKGSAKTDKPTKVVPLKGLEGSEDDEKDDRLQEALDNFDPSTDFIVRSTAEIMKKVTARGGKFNLPIDAKKVGKNWLDIECTRLID